MTNRNAIVIAEISPDTESLIVSVADFMYYLGEVYAREMMGWEWSRVQRLYGVPVVPIWTERALNSSEARQLALRYQIDKEVSYLCDLPRSSRDGYWRANDRITEKYQRFTDVCHRVWFPVYERLIISGLGNQYHVLDYSRKALTS